MSKSKEYTFLGESNDYFLKKGIYTTDQIGEAGALTNPNRWELVEEIKEEPFALSDKWCIISTDDTRQIICNKLSEITGENEYSFFNKTFHYNKNYNKVSVSMPNKVFGDYQELTFEQFKKYVLKDDEIKPKIIAYKSNNLVTNSAILSLLGVSFGDVVHTPLLNKGTVSNTTDAGKSRIELLKKYQVLDLWFTPVYEKTEEEKRLEKLKARKVDLLKQVDELNRQIENYPFL